MEQDPLDSGVAAADDAPSRSRVIKTLQPGQPGTGRWLHAYGDRLVCVRYREYLRRHERHLTVELVLESRPLTRRPAPLMLPTQRDPDEEVGVRIGFKENRERDHAKIFGARWNPDTKLWEMPRHIAERLNWQHRIVRP